MHKKLSDRIVAQLPLPESGRYDCWDLMLPAAGVRISSAGSRTWIAAIRREGAASSSRITLGKFPTLNTAQARAAARALMAGETTALPARGQVFKHHAERFLAHGRNRSGRPIRPATARAYQFVLDKVAAPLHLRPVAKIRRADIAELLHTTAEERGEATAALTRKVLGRFFSWLLETGALESSPATHSPIYTAARGERVLEDAEIQKIWHVGGQFGSVLRLLLLTGARRGEIGGMRWSELHGDVWKLPAERAKNHRALQLPLPAVAVAEINAQPRVLGRDHVFGRGSPLGQTDWAGHKKRCDAWLQFDRHWAIHDIRRTTRTRLHRLGIPHDIVVRIMNHDVSEISRTYDHYDYMPEMRTALNKWADELTRIARMTADCAFRK
jgi:integrase